MMLGGGKGGMSGKGMMGGGMMGCMGKGKMMDKGGFGKGFAKGFEKGGFSGFSKGGPFGTGAGGAGPAMKPGDWTCPNCNDLVFATNDQCRRCDTPKPDLRGRSRSPRRY